MIQLRSNVFETNSSSAHSLVFMNKPIEYYTPEEVYEDLQWKCTENPNNPGKYTLELRFWDGEGQYDRYPFQVLKDFRTKLYYLYAHCPIRVVPPKKPDDYTHYWREWYKVSNFLKKHLPWLEKVEWNKYCDIRPSSEALGFDGALKRAGLDWYEYLFRKDIIVICDGDEYHVWKGMKKAGLINMNNINKEYHYD